MCAKAKSKSKVLYKIVLYTNFYNTILYIAKRNRKNVEYCSESMNTIVQFNSAEESRDPRRLACFRCVNNDPHDQTQDRVSFSTFTVYPV